MKETAGRLHDTICKMECNIDDCTGEVLGYCMERLMADGALDVSYMPIFMKKNRPAYMMTVICRSEDRERLEDIIFAETTTIGIRYCLMDRTILKRGSREVETSLGKLRIKELYNNDELRLEPEYEDVAAIARREKIPYIEALQIIESEI